MPSARLSPRGVAQLPWSTAKRAAMTALAVLAALSVVLAVVVSGQDAGPAADGPTPTPAATALTASSPTASPSTGAREVRDTCAEALRRATALLDAQEDALDAYDDGQPDNFSRERAEARDFNRAGLHEAAEACRNAA